MAIACFDFRKGDGGGQGTDTYFPSLGWAQLIFDDLLDSRTAAPWNEDALVGYEWFIPFSFGRFSHHGCFDL